MYDDAVDTAYRPSFLGTPRKQRKKDTKEDRERRILLYQERAAQNLDIFTGKQRENTWINESE